MRLRQVKDWFIRKQPRAVETIYRGVRFRSTLEADWAYTFDMLGIEWSYEPIALRLSGEVRYRPDFWLPYQRAWCEVKGPHDVRIEKPHRLMRDLNADPFDVDDSIVAILRIPLRGRCSLHGAWPSDRIELVECDICSHWTFMDLDGTWSCRICGQWSNYYGGRAQPEFFQLDPYRREARAS